MGHNRISWTAVAGGCKKTRHSLFAWKGSTLPGTSSWQLCSSSRSSLRSGQGCTCVDSLQNIQLSHGAPLAGRTRCALRARVGPGWSLLQCWCGWAASKSHEELVLKLTRHYSALLPTVAARVPGGITHCCGKLEHGGNGEEAEALGLRHIVFPLDMCPHVPVS